MKQKICYGQMVRVVGADWTFRVCDVTRFFVGIWGADETNSSRRYESALGKRWWPEYLLESAE